MSSCCKDRKRQACKSACSKEFPHALGDVVVVRWSDERIYYAKIKTINMNRQTCQVMFEDNRRGTADFDQIRAVDSSSVAEEWLSCVICKIGTSDPPNQIVLCDECNIAYHQKCHRPTIPHSVLKPSAPWACNFCVKNKPNPYLKDAERNLPSFDEDESKPTTQRLSSCEESPSHQQGSRRKQKRLSAVNDVAKPSTSSICEPTGITSCSHHGTSSRGNKRKRTAASCSKKPNDSAGPACKKVFPSTRPSGRSSSRNKSLGRKLKWSSGSHNFVMNNENAEAVAEGSQVPLVETNTCSKAEENPVDPEAMRAEYSEQSLPLQETHTVKSSQEFEGRDPPAVAQKVGAYRRSARKANPRRLMPSTRDAVSTEEAFQCLRQRPTVVVMASENGGDVRKESPPACPPPKRLHPSSSILPLSLLAEQFQRHYSDVIKSLQKACPDSAKKSTVSTAMNPRGAVLSVGNPSRGCQLREFELGQSPVDPLSPPSLVRDETESSPSRNSKEPVVTSGKG